jgi:hypothetical protein
MPVTGISKKITKALFFCGWVFVGEPLFASQPIPNPFAVGVHYSGVQLGWDVGPRWTVEGRYTIGRSSDEQEVASRIWGARLYFFPGIPALWRPYVGAQSGWVTSERDVDHRRAEGWVAGGFLGVRREWGRRWSLLMDVGPYFFDLHEDVGSTRDQSIEFVGDVAMCFRFGARR